MSRLTKKEIEAYLDLHERRKALQRQARDLDKQAELIEEKLMEYVAAEGGAERSVRSCGFVLAIQTARGSVSWKQEFIAVAGEKKAESLIAAAPPRDVLSVERIG